MQTPEPENDPYLGPGPEMLEERLMELLRRHLRLNYKLKELGASIGKTSAWMNRHFGPTKREGVTLIDFLRVTQASGIRPERLIELARTAPVEKTPRKENNAP